MSASVLLLHVHAGVAALVRDAAEASPGALYNVHVRQSGQAAPHQAAELAIRSIQMSALDTACLWIHVDGKMRCSTTESLIINLQRCF